MLGESFPSAFVDAPVYRHRSGVASSLSIVFPVHEIDVDASFLGYIVRRTVSY